jgi:hypothetical protein
MNERKMLSTADKKINKVIDLHARLDLLYRESLHKEERKFHTCKSFMM